MKKGVEIKFGRSLHAWPQYWLNYYAQLIEPIMLDIETLDTLLIEYNAGIKESENYDTMILRFDSEEDFVFFKLKWS